jgi:hypothetical protein
MTTLTATLSRSAWTLALLSSALSVLPVSAADKRSAAASEAQYQRDAAVCLSKGYKGARNECLSDASTARASREPVTIDPDPGRYARNAVQRCEALKDADRADCVARMQGQGTTSGSVAGGGIYRELVTREVAAAPTPPAAPASAASQ